MSDLSEKDIILLESNGEHSYFSPVQLQSVLLKCFLEAGLEENCYLAEDIALAVEYAFVHGEHVRRLFSRIELDAVVIQILTDTGLADVAAIYKAGAPSVMSVECNADSRTIVAVLQKFMLGTEERLTQLSQKVERALELLEISSASPGLIVELARYYEEVAPPIATALQLDEKIADNKVREISAEDIIAKVSERCRGYWEQGVVGVQSINSIFPSIKLTFFIDKYVEEMGYQPPLTELALSSALFDISRSLEELRFVAHDLYFEQAEQDDEVLPCYLNVPNLAVFVERYFEVPAHQTQSLSQEICSMLLFSLKAPVERLDSINI